MMKDLSDYIVEFEKGQLMVDSFDAMTGELTFEEGEVFSFRWKGKQYKGIAYDQGNECEKIQLVVD